VLVDTNLLLLLYVGGYDRSLVERFSRTADRFVSSDYDTLDGVLGRFTRIVTTPYILAEVSNLLGLIGGRARKGCFELFARSIRTLAEQQVPSTRLAQTEQFVSLGITDSSILEVAAAPYLVLTDDFRLYNHLAHIAV